MRPLNLGRSRSCARFSRTFRVPLAQICAATSAHQVFEARCSQGPDIIPSRNVSTGIPVSTVSTLSASVTLSCFCAKYTRPAPCRIDVVTDSICLHEVDGQRHRYSSASNKRRQHSERPRERHSLHSEDNPIPFRETVRKTYRRTCADVLPTHFWLHVLGPYTFFGCGLLDCHNMHIRI